MKYKTTIELEAVQFTGDLTKMPDWLLNRCFVGRYNQEWTVYYADEDKEEIIHIGDYIVCKPDDFFEILDAETFNKNYTALTAEGEEHA